MYKTTAVFLWSVVQLAVASPPRKRSRTYSAGEFDRDEHESLPRRTVDGVGILEGGPEPSTVRVQRQHDLLGSRLSMMEVSAEGASKTILRGQDSPAHLALEISSDGVPLQSGVVGDRPSEFPDDVHIKAAASKPVTVPPITTSRRIAQAPGKGEEILKATPHNIKKFNGQHLEHLKLWKEQEELNSFIASVDPLDSPKDSSVSGTIGRILDGLSGGTGTVLEPTHNKEFDREIRFRMRMQDIAVLVLLMIVYLAILFFMYSLIYRMSNSDSTVKYYCDPTYHRLSCQSEDVASFLTAFNKRPETNKPQIRVAGFSESADQSGPFVELPAGVSSWRGKTYKTLFYYALDLDTWAEAEGTVDAKELLTIEEFIATKNPLATVSIKKEMVWEDFEEVATNLRAKIRACGFEGPLDVTMSPPDTCRVFQNTRWANFMYNETVKVMTLLSIIGGLVYLPYMWIRSRSQRKVVTSKFKITISGKDYWQLISPKISAHGFGLPQGETPSAPQIRQERTPAGQEAQEIADQATGSLLSAYVH